MRKLETILEEELWVSSMDKPQEECDSQLSLVGRLSYRNGIGIIEDALGFQWAEATGR